MFENYVICFLFEGWDFVVHWKILCGVACVVMFVCVVVCYCVMVGYVCWTLCVCFLIQEREQVSCMSLSHASALCVCV